MSRTRLRPCWQEARLSRGSPHSLLLREQVLPSSSPHTAQVQCYPPNTPTSQLLSPHFLAGRLPTLATQPRFPPPPSHPSTGTDSSPRRSPLCTQRATLWGDASHKAPATHFFTPSATSWMLAKSPVPRLHSLCDDNSPSHTTRSPPCPPSPLPASHVAQHTS